MIKELSEDIIAAVITPLGQGPVAIIRVSGKGSIQLVDKLFAGRHSLVDAKGYTLHYGKIVNKNISDKDELNCDVIIDDVLLSLFREPDSYTGEDAVEINCHGNNLIITSILEMLYTNGARPAEAGEFTKRAFLNNKIDLAQAEAISDIIFAHSQSALKGARSQLNGQLSKYINQLRSELMNSVSLMELELDFAEDDVEFVERDKLIEIIVSIKTNIDNLVQTYDYGRIIKDGINAAIIGKTNVGKSSLLNFILKESKAIVSNIPGTTRDVIEAEAYVEGVYIKLYDTAGIRESSDVIETEGVKRSKMVISKADLVIIVLDNNDPASSSIIEETKEELGDKKCLIVMNKSDLPKKNFTKADAEISLLNEEGITAFLKALKELALRDMTYTENNAVINNLRHLNCLKKTSEGLGKALLSIKENMSSEFVASDLREAIYSLSEIIGEVTTEDILNNIFGQFCIGK